MLDSATIAQKKATSKLSETDSLRSLAEKYKFDDTTKISLINNYAYSLIFSAGNLDEASRQLEISKSLVNKLGNLPGAARCYEIEAHLASQFVLR
jgi:hypothetical protein